MSKPGGDVMIVVDKLGGVPGNGDSAADAQMFFEKGIEPVPFGDDYLVVERHLETVGDRFRESAFSGFLLAADGSLEAVACGPEHDGVCSGIETAGEIGEYLVILLHE